MAEIHQTVVEHDGFAFYWWCRAGCTTHTSNAYDGLLEAVAAADAHRGATPSS